MSKPDTPRARNEVAPTGDAQSSRGEVDAFLKHAKALRAVSGTARGRLVLALDATMSRQPTWDLACRLQGEMFAAAGKTGKLRVQLVYFRGFGECRASKFVLDTDELTRLMTRIDCRGGRTQIGKVLAHAIKENEREKIDALVYIGDAMEEDVDELADKAGQLGLHGVPVFLFQEGGDGAAETAFREIARLSRGAWFRFDRNAAGKLAELLSSIAIYATGGLKALKARDRAGDRLLIEHLGKGR
ncbi:VWA domain-containing protein [Nitratireductor mangrovi]|uniref:VWA domain-containing protein n=1 Tax=Nitratireductor mangrovi TaxID=2599600 RepID=A0A5B8L494_9HYPH|nr:VWA domain-containing protein [Nitratireductor mangrovi]QDZ02490.1 VWA domain-containing protein [Nitratireductor mangrovi]